jgi:hypothetical protein
MRRHPRRAQAILAAAVTVAAVTSGCSSSPPKPKPTASSNIDPAGAYHDKLITTLTSCFYRHNLLPKSSLAGPPPLPVKDGQLQTANQNGLIGWFNSVASSTTVDGNLLGTWLANATTNSSWPTSLCGPMPRS